jgi:hypothetical protein
VIRKSYTIFDFELLLHRSETCAMEIVPDLEKRDAPASVRIRTGLVEGKRR